MSEKIGDVEVGVSVDTTCVDDALEKLDELGEATADLAPMVSFRNLRGCAVNVYVSRNTWSEEAGE